MTSVSSLNCKVTWRLSGFVVSRLTSALSRFCLVRLGTCQTLGVRVIWLTWGNFKIVHRGPMVGPAGGGNFNSRPELETRACWWASGHQLLPLGLRGNSGRGCNRVRAHRIPAGSGVNVVFTLMLVRWLHIQALAMTVRAKFTKTLSMVTACLSIKTAPSPRHRRTAVVLELRDYSRCADRPYIAA